MSRGIKYILLALLAGLVFDKAVMGQEDIGYQNLPAKNPSLTGCEGNGMLRMSYMNYFPGYNYNLHSVSISYDGYFPALHGGAGVFVSDQYLGGIINNLRGGVSYSYYLRASEKIYVCGGLSASFHHRGYYFGSAVLPDQIDPLGNISPSSEILSLRGRTVADLATGFLLVTGKFFGGFSVNHLAEPDPSGPDNPDGKLSRTLLVHGAAEVITDNRREIRVIPMASAEISKSVLTVSAGVSAESRMLSLNTMLLSGNNRNLDLQAGLSFILGKAMIFYAYRFNLSAGENLLPFSILHHTGVAISLNSVDKRKIIRTINLPDL
jgi:type IX secretion system PorP/SprF family membrane protein